MKYVDQIHPGNPAEEARLDQQQAAIREMLLACDPEFVNELVQQMGRVRDECKALTPKKAMRAWIKLRPGVAWSMALLAIYGYNAIAADEWERRQAHAVDP